MAKPKPRNVSEWYVFLASPGDVQDERKAVRQFFTDYNATLVSSGRPFRFVVIDWENFSTTGVGRPQELITKQTLEKYRASLALVIGIMGQRFGSPSGTHESGTEEEFDWAFTSNQQTGWPEVKWFFRNADEVKFPSDRKLARAALDQWDKVSEFRERLNQGKQIFIGEFKDSADFSERLRKDLSLWLEAPERPWAKFGNGSTKKTARGARITAGKAYSVRGSGAMTAAQRETALQEYLNYVIQQNSYLPLRGVYSRGQLVRMKLDQLYVTLKAAPMRTPEAEKAWLAAEQRRAPGEGKTHGLAAHQETVYTVEQALAERKHLVVLGDPGSGKTTMLRYLALCYARDRATGTSQVREKLGLAESGFLPILVLLRDLGKYFRSKQPTDSGMEGSDRILDFLSQSLQEEQLTVPKDLFHAALKTGQVVILFDGMDEVGDFDLRRRVARLIEKFAVRYADCRIVVTSRIIGYTDAARLEQGFATTTIRDFTLEDVEQFLRQWHRHVAIEERGEGQLVEKAADLQTAQLLHEIETHPPLRELAINPLILTVIALLRHDQVKLPEHRADLYKEVVNLLVGGRDEGRGIEEIRVFDDRSFGARERLVLLQAVALRMHEAGQKEIETEALLAQLREEFAKRTPDVATAQQATDRFLKAIRERSGLLVEAGQGVYRFSHLTFQEYLAAVQITEKAEYIDYTLAHLADPFWREVVLLEAGYLSSLGWERVNRLLRAIVDHVTPDPLNNLLLVSDCIVDVSAGRVDNGLIATVQQTLQQIVQKPLPVLPSGKWRQADSATIEVRKTSALRRVSAARAIGRMGSREGNLSSPYWSLPHGEPYWVTIPAGTFLMGSPKEDKVAYSNERPEHEVFVSEFRIARTPVTNAQYWLYVRETGAVPPPLWNGPEPSTEKLWHPVVAVTWVEAIAYCEWLSKVTGRPIRLPTEAEWEKAARGGKERWQYPWGEGFDVARCNSGELGVGETTPVGLFPEGASLYKCLDMSGNVWEWVNDWFEEHYYQKSPTQDPQGPKRGKFRVLRGGSWVSEAWDVRVAPRFWGEPGLGGDNVGFRCAQ